MHVGSHPTYSFPWFLPKANPNVVLVYINGGPISEPWASTFIPAIVELWYPGEEGGTALASVLFGDVNPSGRMPITVVESTAQLPDYLDLHMDRPPGRTHRYITDTPMYMFGYGLSFSHTRYGNLEVTPSVATAADTLKVSIDVACIGGMANVTEVVQVYVGLTNPPTAPNMSVPIQELKAFTRVLVDISSVTTVRLTVPVESLALVDAQGVPSVIPGTYTVWVGGVHPRWETNYTKGATVGIPLSTTVTITK